MSLVRHGYGHLRRHPVQPSRQGLAFVDSEGKAGSTAPEYAGPLADAGLIEWWDPSVLSAGAVSSWAGSKNGWVLEQSVGGAQPTYSATALTGPLGDTFPGVSFAANDNLFCQAAGYKTAISAISKVDVYIIAQDTQTGTSATVILEHTAAASALAGFAVVANDGFAASLEFIGRGSTNYGAVATWQLTTPLVDPVVIFVAFDNAQSRGSSSRKIDNVELYTFDIATNCGAGTYASANLNVGGRDGGASLCWTGIVGDILLFTEGTASQRLLRADWLAARYPNAIHLG